MTDRQRIYVAGPYSADSEEDRRANTLRAVDTGIRLIGKGHFPFIPHLTHYVEKRAQELEIELTWEEYVEWDMSFLELCDAFYYLGSSPGADIELQHAEDRGLTIYRSMESVPRADIDESERFTWRERTTG